MILNLMLRYRQKEEILEACREHAGKFGLEDEFNTALSYHGGNYLYALEDWDLLNEEIVNRIEEIKSNYE